jgi:hypothetical protein
MAWNPASHTFHTVLLRLQWWHNYLISQFCCMCSDLGWKRKLSYADSLWDTWWMQPREKLLCMRQGTDRNRASKSGAKTQEDLTVVYTPCKSKNPINFAGLYEPKRQPEKIWLCIEGHDIAFRVLPWPSIGRIVCYAISNPLKPHDRNEAAARLSEVESRHRWQLTSKRSTRIRLWSLGLGLAHL